MLGSTAILVRWLEVSPICVTLSLPYQSPPPTYSHPILSSILYVHASLISLVQVELENFYVDSREMAFDHSSMGPRRARKCTPVRGRDVDQKSSDFTNYMKAWLRFPSMYLADIDPTGYFLLSLITGKSEHFKHQ